MRFMASPALNSSATCYGTDMRYASFRSRASHRETSGCSSTCERSMVLMPFEKTDECSNGLHSSSFNIHWLALFVSSMSTFSSRDRSTSFAPWFCISLGRLLQSPYGLDFKSAGADPSPTAFFFCRLLPAPSHKKTSTLNSSVDTGYLSSNFSSTVG
jgi:hypothetical protein